MTHTLVGLWLADGMHQLRRDRGATAEGAPRQSLMLVSVLANNAPDLDIVYVGITAGKLGYLLHHRGHTHTLLAVLLLVPTCLGLSAALTALTARIGAARRSEPAAGLGLRRHGRELSLVALLGGGLHLLMDFSNNYGVHPLWPLSGRWFYGDAWFIIEPWLLVLLSGAAFATSDSRVGRATFLLIGAGTCSLSWVSGAVGLPIVALLGVTLVLWSWAARSMTPRNRPRVTALLVTSVLAAQLTARSAARGAVTAALATDPGATTLDRAETPLPGNPLCWDTLIVQRRGEEHVVRRAMSSAWPALWDARDCMPMGSGGTAPLEPVQLPASTTPTRALLWLGAFRAPIRELEDVLRDDCRAAAAARFIRVPFWLRREGRVRLLGDLRYDRSAGLGFAEIALDVGACPRFVPGWQPPFRLH